jgi:hypothetical protein
VKADATPRAACGHNSRANPTYATMSHAAGWASNSAAASVAHPIPPPVIGDAHHHLVITPVDHLVHQPRQPAVDRP